MNNAKPQVKRLMDGAKSTHHAPAGRADDGLVRREVAGRAVMRLMDEKFEEFPRP